MLKINVLQTQGDPIHLELNPDSHTKDLNKILSQQTGTDPAKLMLFNELLENIHTPTISLNQLNTPILPPFTIDFDYENDINHPNRNTYFTHKQRIYLEYSKQRGIWVNYIKLLNKSIEYWELGNIWGNESI
jgi:hypothetical protein